jgi:hypothetical protein
VQILRGQVHRVWYTAEDLAWDRRKAIYPPATWDDASKFVERVDSAVRSPRVAVATASFAETADAWLEGVAIFQEPT